MGLQAFLAEAEHQPVDEISRAPVEQRDVDLVLEDVGGDVAAGVPEARLERVLLVQLAALAENVAPRPLAGRVARDIKNWNVRRPAKVNVVMCNDRFQTPLNANYLSFVIATFLAIPIRPLIAKSTGMHSPLSSPLHKRVRRTPLAAAIMMPTGPFRLSTQPGSGSAYAGVTVDEATQFE